MKFHLKKSFGTSTDCSNEKRIPQWFLHFGTRDTPTKDNTSRNSSVGLDLKRPEDLLNWTGGCTEDSIHREVVKSPLPLVLLGDQYYYFGTYFKTNFFTANEFCRAHGMNLLSIETETENTLILKYLGQKLQKLDHIWTSGSDLGQEGSFIWLSTGKSLNFTYWAKFEPNNVANNEHCLEIWNVKVNEYIWNDRPCAESYNFICELPKCSFHCIS
ncbi:hypothetical protein HHI36_022411 [Cryptolaemus montrouzieri]|uniref:C-type lectin domain-containing protein n=1 Tax=Cryptolaemus montrouzieri TaxID=559131 RepID=A0ABD2MZT5_9CUCU